MANVNQIDGGYYAIKGFAYQIDKTILELLISDNENELINIEQIQDIDTSDCVIQVKYKETAKLIPSQVNKPISKLINEFRDDNTKKYILYAYFNDLNGYDNKVGVDKKISLETLNELLGAKKGEFDEIVKEKFINNFYLDLSKEFQNQFEEVIKKLKEKFSVGTYDEMIFYYSIISDYLIKLVILNPPTQKDNRTCTQKEIFNFLKNGKNLIFNSAFREYQGDQKYFSFIKNKLFNWQNIPNNERICILEVNDFDSVSDIKTVILKIKQKYYNIGNRGSVINSPAPYIYICNISQEKLKQLKMELFLENIIFRDGHIFKDCDFISDSISLPTSEEKKVCLKIINTKDNLIEILNKNLGKTKELYQFYLNEPLVFSQDIKHVKIKINNLSDINDIF